MDKMFYLSLNFFSSLFPLLFSFNPKSKYFFDFKKLLPSVLIVGLLFILHDIYFTKLGVWGFNNNYLIGYNIVNLPIEEWLFFICIPFASLFIHSTKETLHPTWVLSKEKSKIISIILIIILLSVSLSNVDRIYTFHSFGAAALITIIALIYRPDVLQSFLVSYLFIIIPFLIINGILTGSFIVDQVVWYNNLENLSFRIGTIPIEDFFYGFTLLLSPILLSEKI
jgi:lycopene cyclase domain